MPKSKIEKGRIARLLWTVIGLICAILTLPALVIAGLAMMGGDPGVNPAYSVLVYACQALPVLTVLAALRSFKAAGLRR